MIQARRCAVCGEWKNSSKGGIFAAELPLRWAREAGVKTAVATSSYAHLPCLAKAKKQAVAKSAEWREQIRKGASNEAV